MHTITAVINYNQQEIYGKYMGHIFLVSSGWFGREMKKREDEKVG